MMATHDNHPPQGLPPRRDTAVEITLPEHHDDGFSTNTLLVGVTVVILIPLMIWGLKLAITRTLKQSDEDKKETDERLKKLETTTQEQEVALVHRPTYEDLSAAKKELRDEFKRKGTF